MSQPRCPLICQQECRFIYHLEPQLEFHQLFMPVRHQLVYQLVFRLESQRKCQHMHLLERQSSRRVTKFQLTYQRERRLELQLKQFLLMLLPSCLLPYRLERHVVFKPTHRVMKLHLV